MTRASTASGLGQVVEYGVIALAIVLAWQMVVALFAQRAPVDAAVRLAPGSAIALVRAAESEFEAGQHDDAAALAGAALRIAPFNVRALSIIGRTQDAGGNTEAADQTLTLAGNWSLRDDPTHAWLMNRRLRQGDYASAFAHAETMARRETPAQPRLFEMFTVAAQADPRGLSALVKALALTPPWRNSYVEFARDHQGTDQLLADLAINLQRTSAPLSDGELSGLYRRWLDARQPGYIRALQRSLGRPDLRAGVWNGGFDARDGVAPLDWLINLDAGYSAQITDSGESERGGALLVETDGTSAGVIASQLLLLPPGPATIRIRQRLESVGGHATLGWRIICFETGSTLAEWTAGNTPETSWRQQVHALSIPTAGCTAQWIQLQAVRGDRRAPLRAWFDDVQIEAGRAS